MRTYIFNESLIKDKLSEEVKPTSKKTITQK